MMKDEGNTNSHDHQQDKNPNEQDHQKQQQKKEQQQKSLRARQRWKTLRKAILQSAKQQQQGSSARKDDKKDNDQDANLRPHKSSFTFDFQLLPSPIPVSSAATATIAQDSPPPPHNDGANDEGGDDEGSSGQSSFVELLAARLQTIRLPSKQQHPQPSDEQQQQNKNPRLLDEDLLVKELEGSLLALLALFPPPPSAETLSCFDFHILGLERNGATSSGKNNNERESLASRSAASLCSRRIAEQLLQRCSSALQTCRASWEPNLTTTTTTTRADEKALILLSGHSLRLEFTLTPTADRFLVQQYPLQHAQPHDNATIGATTATMTAGSGGGGGGGNVSSRTIPLSVWTRERVTCNVSLRELMSHNQPQNAGVDNTGNICVWDCEKVLVWALWQEQQERDEHRILEDDWNVVLELGAGMAGMAALSLAVSCSVHQDRHEERGPQPATLPNRLRQVYITDGHSSCVQNNRVNVCLAQAAGALSPDVCQVECSQLQWFLDDDNDNNNSSKQGDHGNLPAPSSVDVSCVSDCTHFQEYHGHLLWTLLYYTKVQGQIWMCQPDRGNSLQRFLAMVKAVNRQHEQSSDNELVAEPLVMVREPRFAALDEKHAQFMKDDKNHAYQPNIHRPRIIVLEKLRPLTEEDRLAIVKHMDDRDCD